jgi:hypothetical protein
VRARAAGAAAALIVASLLGQPRPAAADGLAWQASATPTAGPSLQQLRNADYALPISRDRRQPLRLVEGAALLPEREGRVRLLEDDVAYGDLNGDGRSDAVAVLALAPGGSAALIYAVLVLNEGGALRQVEAELLGDRVRVGRISIARNEATVIYLTQRLTDRMCCPTQWTSRTLRVTGAGSSAGP